MIMNNKPQDSKDYNDLREICQEKCLHTTYEFHHWLIEKGYCLSGLKKIGGIKNELGMKNRISRIIKPKPGDA